MSNKEIVFPARPGSPTFGIRHSLKFVRIILLDARHLEKQLKDGKGRGLSAPRIEMVGKMDLPKVVASSKVYTNWRFDELRKPCKGLVCDIQPEGCTIVFAFVEREDAISTDGHELSLDELRQLFLKYNPTFKVTLVKSA